MPANQRQQIAKSKSPAPAPPTSPTHKATAKYTNKDGSKFITVPKSAEISAMSTPTMAPTSAIPNGQPLPTSVTANGGNRKKQKRREKLAAKQAAEQGSQSLDSRVAMKMREADAGVHVDNSTFDSADAEPYDSDEEGDAYSGSYGLNASPPNGYSHHNSHPTGTSKSKKKKKGKGDRSQSSENSQPATNGLHYNHGSPNPSYHLRSPPQTAVLPRGPGISKEKIWNTSSHEERERIKAFWLALGEDERKSLVKVEKDAVLKKMKEQQKHSCSCTVCGRKRTAIEEELEVLYDAYYEELEQYANHRGDQPMMPPPRRFGAVSGLAPPNRLPPPFNNPQPSRGRIVEQLGDDEDEEGDEEYSEDEEDEGDYSEEDQEPEELPRSNYQADFFNFGQSLTVQGGILTVADDLLKNDGKKFIEMMEQLAERRMAREEDAKEQTYYNNHQPNNLHNHSHPHTHTHNHGPPPVDDEYDDEEEDDEYDSQDEDYDEEEEEDLDTMTEEQRMEEGRRMFQIFAARMFEQRVLTAYKEKVAKERQDKLLEELEEESRADSQRKAKKAKDAQRKKEKLLQKKQALADEKAKKDAEKAAEEAALRAAEEKIQQEKLQKAEEDRKKREAQKQAKEAERLKKEAEKLRKVQEKKDRDAEAERKRIEAKTKKEEAARAAKEAKDRELEERKAKQEQERRDKEAKMKLEKEAKEKEQRGEVAAQQAAAKAALAATQAPKRPPIPLPSNLQTQPSAIVSPHVQVATPAVPKAPTPSRLRTASQQESSGSSVPQTPQTGGMSQNVSPVPSTPLQGSPGLIGPPGKAQNHQPTLHHPQASSPMHSAIKSPPGIHPNPFMPPTPFMGFPSGLPMMNPPFGAANMPYGSVFPPQMGNRFGPMPGPNGMPIPPGMNYPQMPQGRGFPTQHPPPGFPQSPNGFGGIGQTFQPKETMPPQSHSRQASGTFDGAAHAQPIARPAPIGRPSSVVHGQHHGESHRSDVDDLSNALGSSALIGDDDEPLGGAGARRSSGAPGGMRTNYAPAPFMDNYASPITPWSGMPNPFGSSSLPGSNYAAWPQSANTSFGSLGNSSAIPSRSSQPRSVTIRLNICRACKNLEGSTPDGFYDINDIKERVNQLNLPTDPPVSETEILDICDTEGNPSNGGGYLEIRDDSNGHISIRHEIDIPSHRPVGAPGEIGSPIVGGGSARFGPPGF